jgi:DNA-binding response OmpR family regulator
MRILVVEDDPKVSRFIQRGLLEERYTVDVAETGQEALRLTAEKDFDLILLDILIPAPGGIEVLSTLRRLGLKAPVLMLTAKDDVETKVSALDLGADDYLTKPFVFAELLARVRALLRRTHQGGGESRLQAADLILDLVNHKVTRAGKEISLTGREFALLRYLMQNAGRVLTKTQIAEHVWDVDFDTSTNVIEVYISYLRNKLDRGFWPRLIHTVRGVGYVLEPRDGGEP